MKTSDKQIIFNILKTASDNFYGYADPAFKDMPVFQDDPEFTVRQNTEAVASSADFASTSQHTVAPAQTSQAQKNSYGAAEKEFIVSEEKQNAAKDSVADSEASENFQKNTSAEKTHGITLAEISEKIANCKKCGLCSGRTNVVPGQGVENPSVLVIGEGPGEEEDKQGLPFVGPAGQLLDKMLASIMLDRHVNCYIANTVKCRPPYNRDPKPEEAAACRSYLDAQINVLKPKMILLVGKVALRNIMSLEGEISLRRYRGRIYSYNGIPLIVTYHPSALLRNTDYKRPAWEDLKFFKSKLLEIDPHYADNFPGAAQK